MSFILQSELDRPYILKLCQEIKLIKQSKVDWTVEHVLRFASLIKIEQSIKDVITNWQIDGNKLFDVQYLNANLDCLITQRNYMPFYKLFYLVSAILQVTEGREPALKQPQDFMNCASAEEAELDIPEETITRLIEQLQRMNNMSVIELSSVQLSRLLKSVHLLQESESVLKWAVDGFSLLCIIGNEHYNQTYKNYYSNQNLKLLSKISHIFTHIYYYQHHQRMQQEAVNNLHPVDQFDVEFNDLNFPSKSFHSSQFGTSEPGEDDTEPLRNSEYVTSVRGSQVEFRNSEFVESVRGSMVKSEAGSYIEGSVRGSVMMESVRGSIMESVRGSVMESVRGSVMESVRGSMRESIRESMQQGNSTHDSSDRGNSTPNQTSNYLSPKTAEKGYPRSGKGEDKSIIEMLMQASLKLPFNLLNLEPLQKIKICSIPYPFNLYKAPTMSKKDTFNSNSSDLLTVGDSSSQRSQSLYDIILEDQEIREFKVFNLTGAKFGRSPQNDFSYPDELSISGRHAQIIFKDESYYIRDLGSKTGTFVYISEKKPLVLSDEQLVQLSYEVEFKVIIIKNDINEGIIKFQFKKPQNEPPYRAILKNNNTVRFGKAQNSHIKLTNQSISSYHAQIKFQEGKFIMYDCNTRTGTWLRLSSKGVRSADRKLSKMDIIRISSKKTFLVQDMTEGVEFLSCCELGKGRFDD